MAHTYFLTVLHDIWWLWLVENGTLRLATCYVYITGKDKFNHLPVSSSRVYVPLFIYHVDGFCTMRIDCSTLFMDAAGISPSECTFKVPLIIEQSFGTVQASDHVLCNHNTIRFPSMDDASCDIPSHAPRMQKYWRCFVNCVSTPRSQASLSRSLQARTL